MTLDPRLLAALTVLPPPTGAHVKRDLVYRTDGDRVLKLDIYAPPAGEGASAVVFLVNGDAPEEVIAKAKDWGVYRSYGEHLAARGIVGVPFNHRSTNRMDPSEAANDVRAAIAFVRNHAKDFGVDADRIGVWVFSAGGALRPAPLPPNPARWVRGARRLLNGLGLGPVRGGPPLCER